MLQFLTMFRRRVCSLSNDENDGLVDAFHRSISHVKEIADIARRFSGIS
jgi:hypothetical protein